LCFTNCGCAVFSQNASRGQKKAPFSPFENDREACMQINFYRKHARICNDSAELSRTSGDESFGWRGVG
jgi:hypothetical protein